MRYYADASFLFSFLAADEHSAKAKRWMSRSMAFPILVTRLTIFEFENAMRSAVIGQRLSPEEQRSALVMLHRALHEGFMERREVPLKQWFPRAHRISAHSTEPRGFGALDILHISVALQLGADGFLSFDEPQRVLAKSEGLKPAP